MPRAAAAAAAVAAVLIGSACSGNDAAPPPAPSAPAGPPRDAAAVDVAALQPTAPDDDVAAARGPAPRPKSRTPRPIDIALKSTPPGATAAVDGRPIGITPTFWAGESDGLEHEFTFTRPGYAYARYRFVPVTSGVLHATLEAMPAEPPPGPMIAPQLAPDAGAPPEPPQADASPEAPLSPPPGSAAPGPAGGIGPTP